MADPLITPTYFEQAADIVRSQIDEMSDRADSSLATANQTIAQLTGSTDDGVDFTPRLVMPITDLGAKSQTRIDCVYAIVRPGTGVTLAVTPQDMGVEDPFEFEPDGAGSSRESTVSLRIKAGLGMRSRMWGLELRGIPGQPFALREADALLIDTRRRI